MERRLGGVSYTAFWQLRRVWYTSDRVS